MKGKNVGFFKGLLTVVFIALVVFVVIYFFFPELSLKYFGTTYEVDKVVGNMVEAVLDKADYLSEKEKEEIEDYLSSSRGNALVEALASALSKGKDGVESFISSEEFRDFEERLGDILSPESFSKLTENIEGLASSLLTKLT